MEPITITYGPIWAEKIQNHRTNLQKPIQMKMFSHHNVEGGFLWRFLCCCQQPWQMFLSLCAPLVMRCLMRLTALKNLIEIKHIPAILKVFVYNFGTYIILNLSPYPWVSITDYYPFLSALSLHCFVPFVLQSCLISFWHVISSFHLSNVLHLCCPSRLYKSSCPSVWAFQHWGGYFAHVCRINLTER